MQPLGVAIFFSGYPHYLTLQLFVRKCWSTVSSWLGLNFYLAQIRRILNSNFCPLLEKVLAIVKFLCWKFMVWLFENYISKVKYSADLNVSLKFILSCFVCGTIEKCYQVPELSLLSSQPSIMSSQFTSFNLNPLRISFYTILYSHIGEGCGFWVYRIFSFFKICFYLYILLATFLLLRYFVALFISFKSNWINYYKYCSMVPDRIQLLIT